MTTRILVVGFDALDYELFSKFAFPEYSVIPLYSPVPMTGPAWSSIYTGLSVPNHGISEGWGRRKSRFYSRYKFLDDFLWSLRKLAGCVGLKPKVTDHQTYSTSRNDFLWDVLSRNDIDCKLFNLPCTYPARKLNGIHVAGFPARGKRNICYPSGIADHIPDDFCKKSDLIQHVSNPYRDGMGSYKPRLEELGFDRIMEIAREDSFELLECFMSLAECSFEMVQFSFVDRIGHVFGMEGEVQEKAYSLVNDILTYLSQKKNCENLLIVSDHGFQSGGPVYGHTYYGTLAWKGANLKTEFDLREEATVKDFMPTILALYDLSHDSDGRIIHEILDDIDLEQYARIGSQTTGTQEEEEVRAVLERRLRNLGYF